MKRIILYFVLVLSLPVSLRAQYDGGNGRGDASCESLNIPLTIQGNNNTIPAFCSLQQNYPNPFDASTNIEFTIAKESHVKIVVYDIRGIEIETIVNESIKPGTHIVLFDGYLLDNGVYFYKISLRDYSETKRMILKK
jgi:hypothetical protein